MPFVGLRKRLVVCRCSLKRLGRQGLGRPREDAGERSVRRHCGEKTMSLLCIGVGAALGIRATGFLPLSRLQPCRAVLALGGGFGGPCTAKVSISPKSPVGTGASPSFQPCHSARWRKGVPVPHVSGAFALHQPGLCSRISFCSQAALAPVRQSGFRPAPLCS